MNANSVPPIREMDGSDEKKSAEETKESDGSILLDFVFSLSQRASRLKNLRERGKRKSAWILV
jgi:hypothetical protein